MKKSGIVIVALSVVLTIVAVTLGGRFRLLINLQPYLLIGLVAVLLVAILNTRRELASSSGRDRLCLRFIHWLASCAVCIGLLVTVIVLVDTVWCARHLRLDPGNLVVSFLPLLYCLVIAEVLCPALSNRFACRIERAEQAASDANSNSTS